MDSAVIRIALHKERPWQIADEALFFRVVRGSFALRRKTLRNGLRSAFPEIPAEELSQILAACSLPETVRGETLGIPEFAALTNQIWELRAQ